MSARMEVIEGDRPNASAFSAEVAMCSGACARTHRQSGDLYEPTDWSEYLITNLYAKASDEGAQTEHKQLIHARSAYNILLK